ncbi:MAG: DNA-binding response regulator [Nitrospirae bacterium CG_4_9_14_3_um_filter_53_35]|nr:MAG: DNA-binding response regulator [Nitrospirae bacterium CG2_30_53_67]PIS36854.1 MAG: DNA-binding response regulator [Nitrospirae bacterium CG08_land_8_20_14_0_20_52_24]PIV84141.1 MAG: DNA-binding response regulator [Nitrospirae bacterium CG17_big_fil_post_rev_8_21_14_2_50_50_9]PIW86130.1 MAG: DNA-binding response regulator [Nitrospirae bacterium CG_4_8_14_3_um_filter_50_41]PIX84787.1 MAG: DNA-binding response regulator [Nitrospirae bacterium CG_4_10_14_3_um_filter_53_41]PJA72726.1 MAG: D
MNRNRILLVDDEPGALEILAGILGQENYEVVTAQDGEEALSILKESSFDLVLTDLNMPKINGLELIRRIQQVDPVLMTIVLTGCGTIDNAVAAMKAGAYDYTTKPFKIDELILTVKRALEYRTLKTQNKNLKRLVGEASSFRNIIGDSEGMQRVESLIHKVSDADTTVLIQGESGTGKELVARAIHFNSPRADAPLIPINCAAIPRDLLESELFGHVKGAFTGAALSRIGRFELADKGTLFLDEIGEMPPELQVKILRVLQEQQFERVGGTKTIQINVRIIAATNKDLEKEIKRGMFREDLYYRLNVIPIHIPPLRDRISDIPLLIRHFLNRFNHERNRNLKGFTKEALQCLESYAWPGNVRELENLVERMIILCEGEWVCIEDIPEKFHAPMKLQSIRSVDFPEQGIALNEAVESFENELIIKALKQAGGVKSKAAKLLNLNRTTLLEKIKKKKLNGWAEDAAGTH